MAAKQVKIDDIKFLYLQESQNRAKPRNAKPKKTGTIPTRALPIIGKVKETVLVIKEYCAV